MREIMPGVRLDICSDRLSARVSLAPHAEGLDAALLISALHGEGVSRAQLDEDAVHAAVKRARGGEAVEGVLVAAGVAVRHGRDGGVEIEPDLAERLALQRSVLEGRARRTAAPARQGGEAEDASHYEVNALCVVGAGERVGRLVPADPGADGVDIFGKVIGAREGREQPVRLEGVREVKGGILLAERAGVLRAEDGRVEVSPDLVIPGAVDFSTGHVRFPGDLRVGDGVRDRFEVWAEGRLEINGLVEAATLVSRGEMTLSAGMAGRGKGRFECASDVRARYLDGVVGEVGRDLFVEREIKECVLVVGRHVDSPRAALLSGELSAGGAVALSELGGAARARACVRVGHAPRVEQAARELTLLAPRVLAEVSGAEERLATLRGIGGKMSAAQAEELTELEFAVASGRARLEPMARSLLRAGALLTRQRRAALRIEKRAHAGARIVIGGLEAIVRDEISGPLSLEPQPGGSVLVRDGRGGAGVDLTSIAEVRPAEGAVCAREIAALVEQLAPGLAERLRVDAAQEPEGEAFGDEGPQPLDQPGRRTPRAA